MDVQTPAATARAGGSADVRWLQLARAEMAVAGGAGVTGGAVLDAGCEGEQEQRTPEQRTPALRETGRARAEAGCWRLQLLPLSHSTHSLTHSYSFLTLMGRFKVGQIFFLQA